MSLSRTVAVSTSSFAEFSSEPLLLLRQAGLIPRLNPHGRTLTEDEAIALLAGCVAVAAGTEPLTARLMDALPDLKVISRCGTGLDNVDLAAAAARGIAVRHTPDAPTRAVAELALGLALGLLRHIPGMDRDMRNGLWKKRMGGLLADSKVGIVGLGRIGRATADLFLALGARTSFFDPVPPASAAPHAPLDLPDLLSWADLISLHAPRPPDNSPLLDAAAIARIKPGAFLINAARGGLVDEDALADALRSGRLAGAALDVFSREPYQGPLLLTPNTILTPHAGSYARESRILMETTAIRNLLEALCP
ncbi:MAG: phosphoglycerate dehydrogenase [Desulfovibrio sp.]|nr:phosphoglycerate dehydrogenase [Desulfovibrio sp.]